MNLKRGESSTGIQIHFPLLNQSTKVANSSTQSYHGYRAMEQTEIQKINIFVYDSHRETAFFESVIEAIKNLEVILMVETQLKACLSLPCQTAASQRHKSESKRVIISLGLLAPLTSCVFSVKKKG